jgi:transcriptional regulator with XRE-family HTH domain
MKITFTSFGDLLRELREHRGLSLSDVSKRVGVKKDFIGKVERGQRTPNIELVREFSTCYGVKEEELLKLYYTQRVLDELDGVDKLSSIFNLVKQRRKSPSIEVNLKEKPQPRTKPKRKYVKGGRNGKVKGLNLYLKDNDKLSKKDREILFRKSEDYINEIIERYSVSSLNDTNHMSIDYLDPNFSDVENVETWNNFYDQYGMMFPEFLEKEEKTFLKEYNKSNGDSNSNETPSLQVSFLQKKKPRVEGMG